MGYLKINSGSYTLNSSLKVSIKNEILFEFGSNYILLGDNGTGKTSFIENVLVPKVHNLAENNFLFLHTRQDISIQYYIVKSYYKGLKKEKFDISTISNGLNYLKKEYLKFDSFEDKRIVFILDEIDQYVNMDSFLQGLNKEMTSIILATQNSKRLTNTENFSVLNFSKVENNLSEITINK